MLILSIKKNTSTATNRLVLDHISGCYGLAKLIHKIYHHKVSFFFKHLHAQNDAKHSAKYKMSIRQWDGCLVPNELLETERFCFIRWLEDYRIQVGGGTHVSR